MTASTFEFGLNSFGDVATDGGSRVLSDAETVRLLVEEAKLAENSGVDVFSSGSTTGPGTWTAPHLYCSPPWPWRPNAYVSEPR
ncbi:hypothetical protein OG206_01835 [Streptomyces sp. NBC_01341]|uniref:hypothetical protein n=1 Tax=Streptomyces sp. NBC_01341 TaxID=2903831 RepID=UPI002E0FBB43|nr:hypothetical protein OG206_01835 [Streptomyces sp. NBC_01341]